MYVLAIVRYKETSCLVRLDKHPEASLSVFFGSSGSFQLFTPELKVAKNQNLPFSI